MALNPSFNTSMSNNASQLNNSQQIQGIIYEHHPENKGAVRGVQTDR